MYRVYLHFRRRAQTQGERVRTSEADVPLMLWQLAVVLGVLIGAAASFCLVDLPGDIAPSQLQLGEAWQYLAALPALLATAFHVCLWMTPTSRHGHCNEGP